MSTNDSNVTSPSSVAVTVLVALRRQMRKKQAEIAQLAGLSPSAWAKVETGKTDLSFNAFIAACIALTARPEHVAQAVNNYCNLFADQGWAVLTSIGPSDDALLPLTQQYYTSPYYDGGAERPQPLVLNTPFLHEGRWVVSDVLRYALDQNFRDIVLSQKSVQPSLIRFQNPQTFN